MVIFSFQYALTTFAAQGNITSVDLSGVDQLTDAFFCSLLSAESFKSTSLLQNFTHVSHINLDGKDGLS